MDLPVSLISPADADSYAYYTIEDENASYLYQLLKNFWSSRPSQTRQEWERQVADYRKTKGEGFEPVRRKLVDLFEASGGVDEFSMLDLGGANGSILYEIQTNVPVRKITYRNVEPFELFVEDCNRIFGPGKAIVGDAEAFLEMPDTDFPDAPYTVFFSSLVCCMIHPPAVRQALARASTLADHIVLYDSIANASGELAGEGTVIFDYHGEGGQYYFAHRFQDYFADLGFELVDTEPVSIGHAKMKRGWGMIHAQRRA